MHFSIFLKVQEVKVWLIRQPGVAVVSLFTVGKLGYMAFRSHRITESESQNHRIVGFGRDLRRSSSPTPLQNRPPTAGCTSRCPGRSWISAEKRIHNLTGQPVPELRHLTIKKFFHMFGWNFLRWSFRPSLLIQLLHTTEKSLAPLARLLDFR